MPSATIRTGRKEEGESKGSSTLVFSSRNAGGPLGCFLSVHDSGSLVEVPSRDVDRVRDPCRHLSGQFLHLISMIYRKNRYEMSTPMQKHRVLSIGLAICPAGLAGYRARLGGF